MAEANSVSLSTDLTSDPYYDDFNETKNFHRILFRPGLAVQSRELTQLQTVLQNQIDRFGSHVFQEGSVVRGCEFNYDKELQFVKLRDRNLSNTEVTPSDFESTTLTGNTSGVTAFVVDSVDGSEAEAPDTKVLYVKYTGSGSNNTTKTFLDDEVLNSNSGLSANSLSSDSTGTGSRLTVGEGIIFAKDHFVRVPTQSTVIGKFSANTDNRVGYDIEEEIVRAGDDNTLNDPARGAYNFNAPGADRLKITASLTTKSYDDTSDSPEFVELIRIKNSEPEFKADKPIYNQIDDYLARRTHEESGNYVSEGLNLRIREHLRQSNNNGVFTATDGGDSDKLSVDVSPGVSYVFGYRMENLTAAHVAVDKGIDFNSVEQLTTTTNYGNYVVVDEVAGNIQVNTQAVLSLRNEAMNAVSNGGFSNTGGAGNEIGRARMKSLEYVSGTPGAAAAQYNLHLFDVRMSNGSFDEVRSVYSSDPTSDLKADAVLESNSAVLNETAFNTGVFNLPASSVRRIRDENGQIDTTFRFLKSFDVTVGTDGTFTLNTGVADEQYPFGTGALNATQRQENFDIVLNESVDAYIQGERIDVANTQASITITSTTSADFDIGDSLSTSTSATVTTRLNKIDGQEKSKAYAQDRLVKIDVANNAGGTDGPWNLGLSDVFEIQEVRQNSTAFSSDTDGTDVTDHFRLDTGQRDNFYNHGRLVKRASSQLSIGSSDHLLVKLAYFTHDTSQGVGYFSVDSYPIDDDNAANTSAITTQEIPIYESPTSGEEFDLRDCIDVRPRITDTASDSTTVGGATTDPSTSTTFDVPSGGLHYSPPNESFLTDLEYYLPRIDKIAIDRNGKFRSIRGTSSKRPSAPPDSSDGMTLAEIDITPYPSITPSEASDINREDLAVKVRPSRISKFTMEDINVLESRVENLEYFTALSLLENDSKALSITDSTGLNKFKNGILVDNFSGGSVAHVKHPDYSAAINKDDNELWPLFKPDQTELELSDSLSSGIQTAPRDVTLTVDSDDDKFSEGETITQGGASGTFVYKVDFRVYLEDVSGTFSTGTITGSSSGDSDTVTDVQTVSDGQLVTLPYSHDRVINQTLASGTRNIAGLLYAWFGELELDPSEDIWVDTIRAPDININETRRNDTWQRVGRAWGRNSFWWRTRVVSTVTRRNRDIENEVIPFMRSRVVNFEGEGLKPDTRFFVFFDGEDVNEYVRPTDSSFANTGGYGSVLTSDSDGNLHGQFRIPNNNQDRFATGSLPVRVTDSATDSRESGAFTSFAETDYHAEGTRRTIQDTVVTTRLVERNRRRRIFGGGGGGGADPVAQTFRVNDRGDHPSGTSGAFLSKVELFFASKDDTQPVIVEVRKVDPSSGQVTDEVIPMSRTVVPSSDVNVSTDSSKPTPISLRTPIFLQTDTDYALVVKPGGNSPNYTVYIARLGEVDLLTGGRIGVNPYTGILFASSNDRFWTAIQEEDLKFNLHFADFGENQNATAVFINSNREYLSLNSVSNPFDDVGEEVHGETTLTMTTTPSANVGEFASSNTSGANGEITLVSGSDVRVKDVTLDAKYTDGEVVDFLFSNGQSTGSSATISSQSTPSGKVYLYDDIEDPLLYLSDSTANFVANTQVKSQEDGQTATIEAIDQLRVDTLNPTFTRLDLEDTSVSLSARLAITTSSRDSSAISYKENEDNQPASRRLVLGRTQETSGLSGDNSVQVNLALSNLNNNRHSPAVDLQKAGLITAENFINDPANTTSEAVSSGGDAETRYITRTVTLAEDLDAEDLRVILDGYRPSGSEVRVYKKILSSDDSEGIEDKSWVEMDLLTQRNTFSDSENDDDFIEYEYEVPTAELTGPEGEIQYTDSEGVVHTGFKYFKVKVVLESTDTVNPPRVKNLRVIALQA